MISLPLLMFFVLIPHLYQCYPLFFTHLYLSHRDIYSHHLPPEPPLKAQHYFHISWNLSQSCHPEQPLNARSPLPPFYASLSGQSGTFSCLFLNISCVPALPPWAPREQSRVFPIFDLVYFSSPLCQPNRLTFLLPNTLWQRLCVFTTIHFLVLPCS